MVRQLRTKEESKKKIRHRNIQQAILSVTHNKSSLLRAQKVKEKYIYISRFTLPRNRMSWDKDRPSLLFLQKIFLEYVGRLAEAFVDNIYVK